MRRAPLGVGPQILRISPLPARISFVTQAPVPQDRLTIGLSARGSNYHWVALRRVPR
jgi:hypothetical protein